MSPCRWTIVEVGREDLKGLQVPHVRDRRTTSFVRSRQFQAGCLFVANHEKYK